MDGSGFCVTFHLAAPILMDRGINLAGLVAKLLADAGRSDPISALPFVARDGICEARGESLRRLAQGIGRGIWSDSDRCTVWIADPRFPLPASWVHDLRRRLTQGPAAGWQEMARAIPRRFRAGGPASAFEQARIVPMRAAA